jgi:O-antigen/teichoic acid export membrane protein
VTASSDTPLTARRIGSQTAILTLGFGAAQGLSFVRNALLGHLLAVGDFGVAAALTITLQLTEMVTDIAADRMLVQADDGDDPKLLDTAHAIMLARGVGLALLLWLTAPFMAGEFAAPHAVAAFQAIALVPLVKGFLHLDWRRAQRRLDNAPSVIMEIASQGAALAVIWPAVQLTGSYTAMLWSAAAQALVLVAVSHSQARTPWRAVVSKPHLRQFVAFGWPVLLSAIPLIAVFQCDRILVAQYAGLEAFAVYTAAFMITVVPATLLTRVGQSLYLPILSRGREQPAAERLDHFTLLCEVTVIGAALYAVLFALAGDAIVRVAFGTAYGGQGVVIGMVAAMWAVRLAQMPVQALFLAEGASRPLLDAGCIRALALLPAWIAAANGASLPVLAACGVAGELASLAYLAMRAGRLLPGAGTALLTRFMFLAVAIAGALALFTLLPGLTAAGQTGLALGALAVTALSGMVLPSVRPHGAVAAQRLRQRDTAATA